MTSMNCRGVMCVIVRAINTIKIFTQRNGKLTTPKESIFSSPFRLLSNGTFLKGIVNSKTCLALNLISLIVMKVTGVPNTSKADLGGQN